MTPEHKRLHARLKRQALMEWLAAYGLYYGFLLAIGLLSVLFYAGCRLLGHAQTACETVGGVIARFLDFFFG